MHTHLTSAWNVVGFSSAMKMETSRREGNGGRVKGKEISGRNMNGRGKRKGGRSAIDSETINP